MSFNSRLMVTTEKYIHQGEPHHLCTIITHSQTTLTVNIQGLTSDVQCVETLFTHLALI